MMPNFAKKLLLFSILLLSYIGSSQEYRPFAVRYQDNLKGDLTFISNQIVNRDDPANGVNPLDPYNNLNTSNRWWGSNLNTETGGYYNYNDYKDMQFIDVDSDLNTRNSSSAILNFPSAACNQIRYVGLYWSATYPRDITTAPVGTPRQFPINQVKLKIPGATTYSTITADDVLFDGLTSPALADNAPYAAYADVTNLVRGTQNADGSYPDPTGEYTVADIAVATGLGINNMGGGVAGGWTMVIVYENPTLTGKLITTFDGFARVANTSSVNINYNGFTTIPAGPVNANIGAAALEGDFRISGDNMRIRAASNPGFTTMSNASNPATNFFNSNITLNGAQLAGRTPSSLNTLGWDTDLFTLNNFANSVIPNGETSATFQFRTSGDQYYPFFNSFNIEIIEPDIVLEKTVEDIAGNDITGLGVNLGQTLDYVLTFQNYGNDDGDNFTIRDVLPVNVTLDDSNLTLPPGVTYTFDPATRTVVFSIPNNLVQVGDTEASIRMRVQVAQNCFDFIDACTDLIQNLAYSTYQGVVNNNQITDDPSVTLFNNCNPPIPGATNFLLDDLENCDFSRTVQLCGDEVVLNAGDNFDSYIWYLDNNNDGLIDGGDTVITDGDPDNDPSTFLVSEEGMYIVDKIVADPCKGFQEILTVERFGSNAVDPIIQYFNTVNSDADVTNDIEGEIVTCSVDGDESAKIFLCGAGDSQLLQTNITDAQTISWELLDENSCAFATTNCANKNGACTWNPIASGSSYTANAAGKYRLVVTYQNGCYNRFYFEVFQNNLDIQYTTRDIICTTDGRINITNIGSGYGFQLIDITNNAILVPFSANNGPDFTITNNGQYRVDVVQLDGSGNPIVGGCIFGTASIGIRDRDFTVDIETTPQNCNAQGTIKIDILNVEPNYTYTLRQADGTLIDDETAQTNNTHTFNVNAGNYIVEAASDDGCTFTQNVTVANTPDPTVSALLTRDIGCSAGIITMTAAGGFPNPEYGFAIWSKDGTDYYSSITDIPGSAYQIENEFTFGWRDTDADSIDEYFAGEEGTYVFVVIDANDCYSFSNPVTISDNGAMTVAITDDAPVGCSGSSDAAITIVPTGGVGPYSYSLDNNGSVITQTTPAFVGLSAGIYPISITDSSGCTVDMEHEIIEPFPLTASAGVAIDISCNPAGAEVRITNVNGGTAPYEYSFDGGGTFGTTTIATLTPGTYTVIVRDATLCEVINTVIVPDEPTPPTVTSEVTYNCNGSGIVTVSPDITTYDYTYEIDGVLNTPDPTSNVFTDITPGNYVITTNYISQAPPIPSLLLQEDFGNGSTIQNANTQGYYYEDQTTGTHANSRPGDTNTRIEDDEYAVTSSIEFPYAGVWTNPSDHTSNGTNANGRYLAINIGAPGSGKIIYQKTINDIIPNQPIDVSLWLINLLLSSSNLADPDLTIELRHPTTGAVVATAVTGSVPNNELWNEYLLSFDPGANTSLDLVITTNESEIHGNDVAIDDIAVYQDPQVCEQFVETLVTVVAGREFEANGINSTNVSCNGLSDGTITFEVENFDAVAGFEYSVDGGANYINSTTSPVTTAAIYGAGSQTILIRKANEITCTAEVTTIISEPTALLASAAVTTRLTCTNGGATISASAIGGTPNYEYQLEDTTGTPISSFDFATNGANTVFTGILPGSYLVRVRDNNACEDPIDIPLIVTPTNSLAFNLSATTCYSGASDGSITVDVTNGNGDYTFSINGNPSVTPTPTSATSYTFNNLANGTYNVQVSDGLGCLGAVETITINPELTVSATAPNITACATSTNIDITAAGGDANYVYAVVSNGTAVVDADFSATNPVSVTTAGDYDVYVRDNGGNTGYCSDVFTITIVQDAPIVITATPTHVTCFGASNGAIDISVDSGGLAPFTYSIDNGTTYVVGTNFPNLAAGTYPVRVRDANGCETVAQNIIVDQPAQLVAEAVQTQDYTCIQLGQITVGSITPTSGGSGDYQYSINGGAWTASTNAGHTFVDLTDDTYTIQVRDANATSCQTTLPNVIIAPLPTEPVLATALNYNCDGTADVTVTPFDTNYIYILDGVLPGQTGTDANILTNVAVGNHTITVNYGSDCTVDIPVVVEDGHAFEATISAFENLSCNANASGTITITADNFGAGGYQYSLDATTFVGPFSADEQITGLSAQAYTITVRDVDNPIAGCTIVLNQTLSEPTPVVADAAITEPFTCNNTGATITASATGGTPNYQYQLENNLGGIITAYQNNTTFTNLAAGEYIVRARDTNNCDDSIDTTITVVAPANPTFNTTPTACYSGANDGTIVVDVTSIPGNGGFQFSINAGPWITPTPANATTHTFDNLANGTFTIDVRDAFGCAAAQQTVTLNPELTVSATAPNITACATSTNIDITAAGGDANYVYAVVSNGTAVVDADFSATNPVSVTTAGDYDVYVRDNGGNTGYCSDVFTITIVQDAPIVITATPTHVTCFGASNGAIDISVDSGGLAPFTYSIDNGTTYVVGTNFPNLAAGTYPVRVRDANGCETVAQNIIVDQPAQLVAEAVQTQDYTCIQLGQITVGSITPTSGGSGDYQYSINGGAWTASTNAGHTFVDLTDDTYTIQVRDANATSCQTTLPNVIIAPLPTEPVLATALNYNCDGTADVTVTPFDTNYIYILDGVLPGQTGTDANILTNVAVGNHTITVNYGSDCTVDIPVVVEDGHAFEATISAFENLSCNANASGTITITADNFGAGGYQYSLDATTFVGPFSADEQITGLSAQAYTITVRDVDNPIAGCTIVLNQTLSEPTPVVADAAITEPFTCNNTGATITASATGGTPNYQYQLENNLGGIITAYQNNTTFTNLAAGEYIVRARDTNNCDDSIDTTITVVAPANPTFNTTPTACYSGANDGTIVVDVTSIPGNGGFQFSINAGPWITPTPANATTHTFDNLANGTFTIDVRDAFGCAAAQQTVTLNPLLAAIVDVTDISTCADGNITVTASGGDGNFAYAFVPSGAAVTNADFGLANTFMVSTGNDGDYDVYVWDNNAVDPHCEFMETVTVDPATAIAYVSTPTDPDCHDGVGSIEVTISSGDNPYTIQIIDLDNAGASNQTVTNVLATTQSFYNLAPGNYTINVTDANNCTVTDTPILINNPDELTATISPILPSACGSTDPNDFGFRFDGYPTTYPVGTSIEFSADGGTTWSTSDTLMGYISGTSVFPSMRTVIGGVEICRTDLPRYIIPYPLDDLDISISTVVVACNELQVTVQGTAGVPNYEYTYTDDPLNFDITTATWTTAVPGAHTWTGLIPGRTYIFYVRDSTGCVRQSNVNVNDITTNPLEITSTYEPSCSGANDAEITYTISDTDATTHPNMRWEFYNVNTGALVQTNAGHPSTIATTSSITVTGLAPGEYFIVVTEVDASNVDACVSGSENLLVEELNPITATLNKLSDISCNAPGLIAIENINGGGGTFTYTVTGPATFTTITASADNPVSIPANSPAGDYNVTITDQFGCFTDLGPINLTLTPNPTIDSMVVDNCASPTSLTINATSSAAQILYSIDGGTTYVDNGGVFNNLAAGTYTVSIIDSNGCTDSDTIDIHPVLEANVSLSKLLDCTASPDAEISIVVTLGSGNYDYEITNGLGNVVTRAALPSNPYVFNTAIAEDYVITIYDNNTNNPECNRTFPVTVPAIITPIFTETHMDVTCNSSADGSITLTETPNGINPLSYSISPSIGSFNAATNTFEGLAAGTYSITGTGTNSCTFDILNIVIDEPAIISIPAPAVVEFGCTVGNNSNNATITIDETAITGGSNSFVRYEFINDQGTVATGDDVVVQNGTNTVYTETNILGGTYIINAYDDNGCVGSTTATILPYVEISDPTVTITQDITCNPGDDAEINVGLSITPAAGATDLSYAVVGTDNAYNAPNQTSNAFTNLGVGNYLVTVTNHLTGCFVQTTFEIEDPNTFEIETAVTDVICFGDNGTVSFTISDAINPYANGFTWQVYNSQGTAAIGDDTIIASATGTSVNLGPTTPFAIPAGEYRVEITQDSDPSCVNNAFFTIAGPSEAITANTSVTPITCLGNNGVIEITDVRGGWGDYQYYVGTVVPTAGDYITTTRFDALAPGTYQAWVMDQNGCQQEIQNTIVLDDPAPIAATLQVNQPNCPNFSGIIEVIGTTGGQGSNYLYQLIKDGTPIGAPQNTTTFSGLDAGSYTVQIDDQWSCTFTTLAEILYEPIVPLTTVVKTIDCTVDPGGHITITQTGGSGNFDYLVTFPDGTTTDTNTTGVFTTLTQVGDYVFTITDQAVGHACPVTITQNLQERVLPVLNIDAFTDVTCNTANDGSITISALDNGVGPYTFEIISGPGSTATFPIAATSSTNTTAVFNGLEGAAAPGITYTIRATAANECTTEITQVIMQPEAITNVNATVMEFGCTVGNNSNNATITIDETAITGGSNSFVRYEFINDQGTVATGDDVVVQNGTNTVYTETNILGGTYIINAYDDNGCVGSTTATILPYVEISDPTVTITQDITCNPGDDAEINVGLSITPAAGATDLSYAVVGTDNAYNAPNQTSNAFTNLGVGNYLVTVTNHLTGCFVQTTFEIEDPNTFEIETAVTDVICFGDNGTVSFTISDAINPYANGFTWQVYNSQGTAAIGDDTIIASATGTSVNLGPTTPFAIPAGEYRVEITQDSDPSCVNNAFFTIAGPSEAITANTSVTPITCLGNNGVIEITDVRGGWGDYQYYVGTVVPTAGDYITTTRFDALAPGTYQAWVMDQNGCQQEIQNTIVLDDPAPIAATLQVNQPNCPNFSGIIEVIGTTGGQGSNYLYQLIKDGTPIGAPQNTTTFSGLDAGSYTVQIDDQWSCTFTTLAEILYEPIVPLTTVVKTIDCTVDPGGHITITQTGGSGNFDYLVTFPDGTTTDTNTTGVFTTLTQVGDYVFTITDQAVGHACPVTITQNLQERVLPVLNIDAFTDVTCNTANDGSITISALDNGVGPYTFEIISGPGSTATFPIAATSSTNTTAVFNGLEGAAAPGITYTIRATAANECTTEITQVIMQPEAITNVNATVVEFGCTVGNNSNNATITIDETAITGGSNSFVRYEFINTATATTVQDGANSSYTETNFNGGTYTINVYDDNGCIGSTSATILPFISIAQATVTTVANVSCNPGNDGQIQVGVILNPSTATANLEYTTTGINVAYSQTNTNGVFGGLGIGNYTISVTNLDTNCISETTYEVRDPNVIEIVATKLTDVECLNNNVADGSFSVEITNYTGNYAYQVYDNSNTPVAGFSGTGNTSTPLLISNLPGGVYYVRITETEQPFCEEDSNSITINSPELPVSITFSEQASPSCTDDQGSILVSPSGGVAPYTIVLTNTTTSQSYTETNVSAFIFSGLSGGNYTISVTDALSCPVSDTTSLLTPDALTATIAATPLTCFNDNTGTVTASVNTRNVTPNYLYRLNRYDETGTTIVTTSANQTSSTFVGLNAGFYSITASDDVGCSADTPILEISNPTQVNAQLIRTSPLTCATGIELLLTASGGSGSYDYSIDNSTWFAMSGNTQSIPNTDLTGPLGAGTYRYFVRDATYSCTAVQSNEITEDAIETLVLTVDKSAANINCNGDDTAAIYASATGGLGNYMFELYSDASLSAASRIEGPQRSGEFTNLSAGTYFVNVISEDCTVSAEEVIIDEPTILEYTDEVIHVECFGDDNGSITINLSGGAGGYQYAISPNLSLFDEENTFNELAPGDYTIIAQDQNGCFLQLQYTITAPEQLVMTATATPETCTGEANGEIDLAIVGGTAPYSTRLSSEANFVQDRISLTDLTAGDYIIFVRDANGCEANTGIRVEAGVNLNATVTPVYECTGLLPDNYVNLNFEDPSVIGDVLYALDSTDPADMQLNVDFRNSTPGMHYIAIAHSNGCVQTVDFEIEDFQALSLTLEQSNLNEFTATTTGGKENYTYFFEGENYGSEAVFRINKTDTYVVTVVDANGCETQANIFMEFIDIEIPNFFTPDGDGKNDTWAPRNQEAFPEILTIIFDRYGREVYRLSLNSSPWDGLYNQHELPTGDYWYVIKLRGENDDREFVGHFTLYR